MFCCFLNAQSKQGLTDNDYPLNRYPLKKIDDVQNCLKKEFFLGKHAFLINLMKNFELDVMLRKGVSKMKDKNLHCCCRGRKFHTSPTFTDVVQRTCIHIHFYWCGITTIKIDTILILYFVGFP